MLKHLATLISWVFQPLLMPVFAAILFMFMPFYAFSLLPDTLKWYVIICNLLFTVMIPVLMIFMLLRYGIISSLQLEKREDRKYPILVTVLFHFVNFYFLSRIHLPGPYLFFLMAGMASLILTFGITYFWKISMHMTGVAGLCGAFVTLTVLWPVDFRLLLAVLFMLAGAIGSARLYLQAHTPAQVTAGFFAGFLPQLAILLLF